MIYIIGCGGGGSWLAPKLVKLEGARKIAVMDGDTLELANLDRQFFKDDQIGQNKADALAALYPGITAIPSYFSLLASVGMLKREDFLFCCADNHPCRKAVLDAVDSARCRAIILGNEYVDAEAYFYEPSMLNTPNDPRIVYPVINTSREGDPLAPEGCTGVAQEKHPQLVLANDWATGLALQLYWFHTRERQNLDPQTTKRSWPIHHRVSCFKFTTIRYGDRLPPKEQPDGTTNASNLAATVTSAFSAAEALESEVGLGQGGGPAS